MIQPAFPAGDPQGNRLPGAQVLRPRQAGGFFVQFLKTIGSEFPQAGEDAVGCAQVQIHLVQVGQAGIELDTAGFIVRLTGQVKSHGRCG